MRLALKKHNPAQMQIRRTAKMRMMAMTTLRFILGDGAAPVGKDSGLDVFGESVKWHG